MEGTHGYIEGQPPAVSGSLLRSIRRSEIRSSSRAGRYIQPDYKSGNTSVAAKICTDGAKLVRNLEIHTTFGTVGSVPKGIGLQNFTAEEYNLYLVRDGIRKLVELLGKNIGTLKIIPTIGVWYGWQPNAALFFVLGPFQMLSGVTSVAIDDPIVNAYPHFEL